MRHMYHPRRSVLFMPATNARAVEKAGELPCDGVILDLEDSIVADQKEAARNAAIMAVRAGGFGAREVVVRVNATGSGLAEADIWSIRVAPPHAILLPKIESAEEIRAARIMLDAADMPKTRLWAMIESAGAILNAKDIAAAGAGLSCLVIGPNDLARDLRLPDPGYSDAFLLAQSMTVLAARAAGIDALDGVYNNIGDAKGYLASCERGAKLGFDGKTVIHPNQIDGANAAFSPSAEVIERAQNLIAAFEAAGGKGVVQIDGRMVEELHIAEAHRILALANATH